MSNRTEVLYIIYMDTAMVTQCSDSENFYPNR